jgi:hypothetical protein
MRKNLFLLLLLLLFAGLAAVPAQAHGGEDHGDAKAATPAGATTFNAVATSEQFEVLLRYAPLKPGADADMRLFLSDFATNAPIKGAKFIFTSPEDPKLKFETTEKGPGEYLVETTFPAKKPYSMTVQVVAGDRADLLLLEGLVVGKELPVATAPTAATPSLFASWKTILALVGAFGLGIALTAVLLRRRRSEGAVTSEKVLTASRRSPFS